MTRVLHLDVETRSTVDLRRAGAFVYFEHPSTQIIVACFAFDDGPVQTWWPGEKVPRQVGEALDDGARVLAFNATFERLAWMHILSAQHGWPIAAFDSFECVMARSLAVGLPGSLDAVARALRLPVQKDAEGHRLMLRMSKPRKTTDDGPVWWTDSERMDRLAAYCRTDVEVERAVSHAVPPLPSGERAVWLLDQRINQRGVTVDLALVAGASSVASAAVTGLDSAMHEVTGGQVRDTRDVAGLKTYIEGQIGYSLDSVDKASIAELLDDETLPPAAREALNLRRKAAKSSLAKLKRMQATACEDGRVRGCLQYAGAASTMRWAGRLIQPQNLPRAVLGGPSLVVGVREATRGRADVLDALLCSDKLGLLDILQRLLRPCLVAALGHVLIGADYSAVEARILAWLAGSRKVLALFERGEDVYLSDARAVGATGPDARQLGKVLRLALGFGMGGPKLVVSAAKHGVVLEEDEAQVLKGTWRAANPEIVALWRALEVAVLAALSGLPGTEVLALASRGAPTIIARRSRGKGEHLALVLPSDRPVWFPYARVELVKTPWGQMKPAMVYEGPHPLTRQWGPRGAYGGLLAENITQAVARDCLAYALVALETAGWPVVLTVHDEVICEVTPAQAQRSSQFEDLMTTMPDWAYGLPLTVQSWVGERYAKG